MDFALTADHEGLQAAGRALGHRLTSGWSAGEAVRAPEALGFGTRGDVIGDALFVEGASAESPSVGMVLALHGAAIRADGGRRASLVSGLALSTDALPTLVEGRLVGRVPWAAPVVPSGAVVVGVQEGDRRVACRVDVGASGVEVRPLSPSGLVGVPWAELSFDRAPCEIVGPPEPAMAWARVFMAAVALGIGRRALHESLRSAAAYERRGPGGEQTLQGLVADAATELDAATVVTWSAITTGVPTLSAASMAKLLATEAAQGAVLRATQVVGAPSFARGHVLAGLSEDVRALELFGGRTEALRESISTA